MNTKTLRFWKEYKREIDDLNEPLIKWALEAQNKAWAKWKRDDARATLNAKKRNQYIQRRMKELHEWSELPFYKKIGKTPPEEFSPLQVMPVYSPPMPMGVWPWTKKASWEDFLDWLTKKELDNKDQQNIKNTSTL